jgi:hypothetical protein
MCRFWVREDDHDHYTADAAAGRDGSQRPARGASLNRSIKQLPARHRIGVLAFARYSQAADLANGIAWYAILGVGTALLTLLAAAAGLADHPSTAAAVALWVTIAATLAHFGGHRPGSTHQPPPTAPRGSTRQHSLPSSTASNAGRRSE